MDMFVSLLIFCLVEFAHGFGKFSVYMEEKCGETVHVDVFGKHAGRLRPTRTPHYKPNMNCVVTMQTAESHQFVVVFRRLQIEYEPFCDDDYLEIFDGNSTSAPPLPGLPRKLCGSEKPDGSYVSTDSVMTVLFRSDSWDEHNGFDFIFTIFHTGVCVEGEFKCTNDRCISQYLECDGWNNCGDDSDECPLSTLIILAIIISIVFVTLIATSVVLFLRKRHKAKMTTGLKKDLSSSTLHEHIYALHNKCHTEEEEKDENNEENVLSSRTSGGLPW